MKIETFAQEVCSQVLAACAGADVGQESQDALFRRVYDYLGNSLTGEAIVKYGDVDSCTPALFQAVSKGFSYEEFDKMVLTSNLLVNETKEPEQRTTLPSFLKVIK